MNEPSILWHDYETFGVNPRVDFPVQFAAIRTNLDLEIIDNHININWLCKMPFDYLPHPTACLVTGITPAFSHAKGSSEPSFAKKIHGQMSTPNTCVAGYNSMRFDEEVTRHLLFRNLFPVYEREFAQQNSRWDIIDLLRACYALRPEGIKWPTYDDGKPSFTLEALSQANEIGHDAAHDALSDVHATIGLAKLIKNKQAKLYEYYWQLRNKHKVLELLQQYQKNVFVFVSGFISGHHGACTLIMPVCAHPSNNNAVLCIDLSRPVDAFAQNDSEILQQALFSSSPSSEGEIVEKPRMYSISANKCPFIAPMKTLGPDRALELNIDIDAAVKRFKQLSTLPFLGELCKQVFSDTKPKPTPSNVDEQLYSSEFPSPADTTLMKTIRDALPEQLEGYSGKFESAILNQVFFRYRARNFPNLLNEEEIKRWQQHIEDRLTRSNKTECLSLTEYFASIDELSQQYQQYPEKMKILNSLRQYALQLTAI